MSADDLKRLKEVYAVARRGWERAKAALLVAAAAVERTRTERESADRALAVHLASGGDGAFHVEAYALAVRDEQAAKQTHETATKAEHDAADLEKQTLAALVGVLPR